MRKIFFLASSLAGLAACSGDTMSDPPPVGTISCQTDSRAETYKPDMAKMGQAGRLQFVLVASDPAPPIKGNNVWTLRLLDATGAPVSAASITTYPYMPDHGHGTSAVAEGTPTADGYRIAPVYLFMAGLWQVTFTATAGGVTDTAVYSFCIEG